MINQKTAIVTGAGRGIGAAIATDLAAAGYAVMVHFHTGADAARALADALTARGFSAGIFAADLSDEQQAAALVDATISRFGRLDLLVNNAGIAKGLPLAEIDAAHIAELCGINIAGLLYVSKHAALHLPAGGSIINISSVNATSPVPGGALYSGTKAAVNAITIALARELGPRGIRVNAVSPGLTMTARYEAEIPDDVKQAVIADTPLRRLGAPEDITSLVRYLASEAAGWITGQIIAASGGAV